MKLINKASKFTVKYTDDDKRIVKGYASVFNNLDSDNDVIFKGAFKRSIKEWGPEGKDRIKLVAQHKISMPVAKILVMKEDANGLYIEARFGTHRDGEDYYKMTKEGIVNEFSVGFVPVEKEDNEHGGYDIKQIKLYEISMVTVAANEEAVVTDVKSADPLKLVKQVEDEELAHKLEHEILKLLSETPETDTSAASKEEAPGQTVEKEDDFMSNLNTLLKNEG